MLTFATFDWNCAKCERLQMFEFNFNKEKLIFTNQVQYKKKRHTQPRMK